MTNYLLITTGNPGTVETPTFAPLSGGTYNQSQSVAISDATAGAAIHYTTDGTSPNAGSPLYSSPITVNATETVRAIGIKAGLANSLIGTSTYTFQVATPSFAPPQGTYGASQSVTISCTPTAGATIYYTTDGSDPLSGGTAILTQPSFTGIFGPGANQNLWVHGGTPNPPNGGNPANGVFGLISEQPNPQTSNHLFQVNGWNAAQYTGFTPNTPATAQLAYAASGASTTAQAEGGTVGVYMQTTDLPGSPANSKQMITPQLNFNNQVIWVNTSSALNTSMDIQAPTMTGGSNNFINVNHQFYLTNNPNLGFTLNAMICGKNAAPGVINASQDLGATNTYIVALPLGKTVSNPYMNSIAGQYVQGSFSSPTHHAWSFSWAQFASILQLVQTQLGPITGWSLTPSDWTMTEMHVNAEMHFQSGVSDGTLGWSMSNWSVTTSSSTMLYSGPVTVSVSETLKAIGQLTGYSQSAMGSAAYVITVPAATPVISPANGYNGAQTTVTITDTTPSNTIYYTTNGVNPTTGDNNYNITGPFSTVSSGSEQIKAMAIAPGFAQSATASVSYTIQGSGTGPSAVTGLQLLSQGRNTAAAGGNPGNPVPDNANRQILGWVQATPQAGTTIASNRIYVTIDGGTEGILTTIPATTSYIDSAATGCLGATATPHNAQGQSWPAAHGYLYRVSAIDSNSVEGPKSDYQIFQYYLNGSEYAMAGDFNSGMTTNYHNAITGSPFGSTQDVLNTPNAGGGQWLPWAGNHATCYNIWVGSGAPTQVFKYLNISIKPTATNQQINAWIEFRTDSNGDPVSGTRSANMPGGTGVVSGPNPMVAGQWNTYKLLLSQMMYDNNTATLQGMMYKLGLNQAAGALTAYEVDNVFLSVS